MTETPPATVAVSVNDCPCSTGFGVAASAIVTVGAATTVIGTVALTCLGLVAPFWTSNMKGTSVPGEPAVIMTEPLPFVNGAGVPEILPLPVVPVAEYEKWIG